MSYRMSKDEARGFIQSLIGSQTPVHPNFARQLYERAELPMPEHLKPRPPMNENTVREVMENLSRALFSTTDRKEDTE